MIRETTNGVLTTYRSNLMTSFSTVNDARDKVLTQRNYATFGEDPASATQEFQLRRSWQRTSAQYTVTQSTAQKFESAWQTLASVEESVDTTASNSALSAALRGANDPTGSGRNALGSELIQLSESIIQMMNNRYGDDFIFSGADGMNVPFTWDESGALYYRGVNVNATPGKAATAKITVTDDTQAADFTAFTGTTVDGSTFAELFDITVTDANGLTRAWNATDNTLANGDVITLTAKETGEVTGLAAALNNLNGVQISGMDDGTDGAEYDKLLALANEGNFVDIGIGMKEDEDGNLIESSAFNDALQGINYLGYGVDEDGDPKNIACIIKELGQLLSNCDEDGYWGNSDDADTFQRLMGKLETASSNLKSSYVQLDAKASFLKSNESTLETNASTINEQFLEISQCDLADAITAFSWAQYCYNAALKVGNQILSQSLMDYLD
jgi:flagellin-like hook-associated protein FlgL